MADFLEIIKSGDFKEIQRIFIDNQPNHISGANGYSSDLAKYEFNVDKHDVMNPASDKRPDKTVWKPVVNESTGEARTNADGSPMVQPEIRLSKILFRTKISQKKRRWSITFTRWMIRQKRFIKTRKLPGR